MGSPRPITLAERLRRYDLDGSSHLDEGRKPRYSMPNGSYPIDNCSDVSDAWHLRGHSNTYGKEAVGAYVKRSARLLGCPVPGVPDKKGGQPGVGGVHISKPLGNVSIGTHPGTQEDGHFDQRYDKDEVSYGPGNADTRCGTCKFFNGKNRCSLVRGTVEDEAWCNKFQRREGKSLADADGDGDTIDNSRDGINDPDGRAKTDGDDDDEESMSDTRACKCCAKCNDKCDGACCKDCVMGRYEEINPKKLEPRKGMKAAKLTDKQLTQFAEIKLSDQDIATTKRSWMPVFPEGEFNHPEYGDLVFNDETIPQYIENFNNKVRHIDPCVDIDHRNEEAAGWIKQLDWRKGIGLFALVDWNDLGVQLLKDKRYRYASAQFGDFLDEETGKTTENVLSAITLTNFPFLKRMEAVMLNERDQARELYAEIKKLHERIHVGKLAVPEVLHKTIDLWLDGRVLKGIPHPAARLSEGRAIAKKVKALLSEKAMGRLTRSEFIKNNPKGQGGSGMARADDDDASAKKADDDELDDDEMGEDSADSPRPSGAMKGNPFGAKKAKGTKKADDDDAAKKAKKADDDELDDDEMDDDDSSAKKASISDGAGYDSDDVWGDASMQNYRSKSEQPQRSDGQAPSPSPTSGKKAMAEPRTLGEFRQALSEERAQRIALERVVAPIARELRETKVAEQVRFLAEGSIAYGAKVLAEFEKIALADKKRGNDVFHFLKLAREEGGLILMGEFGDSEDADDLHDLLESGSDTNKRIKGDPVVGARLVRLAKEYARDNKLNWDDPEDKLAAMQSVSEDRKLADDSGYARRSRR